jgi:hypothetical protein
MLPFYPLMPTYCEPGNGSVFSEPVNTLTSLAMIAGGFYALRVWKNQGNNERVTLLLIGLQVLIGLNSALFHATRADWLLVADVVPIVGFMVLAFAILLSRVFAQSRAIVAVHLIGFLLACLMVTMMITPRALGSGGYFVVPLVVTYVLGATVVLRARLGMHDDQVTLGAPIAGRASRHFPDLRIGYVLLQVGVLLALGLLARAYDLRLCATFPFGLHMVWHLIVALAATILTVGIIRYTRTASPVAGQAAAQTEPS